MLSRLLSRYWCRNSTAHTTAGHSRRVVSSSAFSWLRVLKQYPVGLVGRSGGFCSRTQPLCLSHSSVSTLYWCSSRSSARTGPFVDKSFKRSTAWFFRWLTTQTTFLVVVKSLVDRGGHIREVRDESLENITKSQERSNLVCVAGFCHFPILSVAGSVILWLSGRMTSKTELLVFEKHEHLFSISITPAPCSSFKHVDDGWGVVYQLHYGDFMV